VSNDLSPEPKLTRRQAAIIGAFPGTLAGPFSDMHAYIDSLPGFKGIMTHNLGDKATVERIEAAAKADFLALCPSEDDPK
jgi:hypothetical protein